MGGARKDINNYASATGVGRGGLLAAAASTTALNILSESLSGQIEGLFGNNLVAPRFQAFLTSSGTPLIGVQTIVTTGTFWKGLEVGLDFTPSSSNFSLSLGLKAHDIEIPGLSGLSASPFVSISDSGWVGISGGTDLTYRLNSWLGVSGTVGYRGDNPLNEIEGVATGLHGRLSGEFTF